MSRTLAIDFDFDNFLFAFFITFILEFCSFKKNQVKVIKQKISVFIASQAVVAFTLAFTL